MGKFPPPALRAESSRRLPPMARRLTTAEILAAARAADGKRSAPEASSAEAWEPNGGGVATMAPPAKPVVTPVETVPAPPAPVPANGLNPPSVGAILREVKAGREAADAAEVRPPSMTAILAQVRGARPDAAAAPPSVAAMLAEVRRHCGTTAPESKTAAPAPAAATLSGKIATIAPAAAPAATAAPKRRPSTAEILAVARRQAAGGTAGVAAVPPSSAGTVPARPSTTADILAAARQQGAVSANAGATASVAKSPRPKAADRTAAKATATDSGRAEVSDGKPRPKAIAEILAAVRAEAAAMPPRIDPSLPPLVEMVAALRRLDERRHPPGRVAPAGFAARLRRWLVGVGTDRGASI